MKKIISIIIILGVSAFAFWKFGSDKPEPTTTPIQNREEEPVATPVEKKKYKDGTYSATGSYVSPAGPEQVELSLVIKDDKVVSANFVGKGTNPTTMKLQGLFKAGFSTYVVGRNIDEISLTVVNGSSLTPKGFTDALLKIKNEAKA